MPDNRWLPYLCYCPWCETPTINKKNVCKKCHRKYEDTAGNVKDYEPQDYEIDIPMVWEVLPDHDEKSKRKHYMRELSEVKKGISKIRRKNKT